MSLLTYNNSPASDKEPSSDEDCHLYQLSDISHTDRYSSASKEQRNQDIELNTYTGADRTQNALFSREQLNSSSLVLKI